LLLQVLDDGRITDSQGRTVDFKNTILILTSNIGADALLEGIQPDGTISAAARNTVDKLLHQKFRPEFLNRLDEIICYKPLTKPEIGKIVDLLTANLQKRLAEQQVHVVLTDAAKNAVIEEGYDPNFGARPLKRLMQRKIETALARMLLGTPIPAGTTITVDNVNGEFVCNA
ncbi:MAG: AAA family ATPase, partial [Oscillospiraceae bacterium]|nr:AAA family ATPase [Oscillospiraceae bacterium]